MNLPLFPLTDPTRDRRDDAASPGPARRWRWFWAVLAVAAAARLAMGVLADIPVHPDELFQYLEQGYRMAYGYGLIPWEYVYGIRSWLIPGVIGLVLEAGRAVGLDRPALYMPLVQAVFVTISLLLPVGMYRLTQRLGSERAAVAAFLLGCFWHHFLFLAPKPMPSILAAYGLVWMCLWMLMPPSRGRLLALGLLSGLILVLRYQLLPVIGLLNLFALIRLGRGYGPAALGNAIALLLAGLLDLATWGGFLSSFIDNFRLNFLYDISSDFGRNEALFYAKRLTAETGGLVLPAAVGLVLIWRRAWPIIVALLAGLAFFHLPAHKELRFVIWLVPFVLIAAVIAVDRGVDRIVPRQPGSAWARRWPMALLAAVALTVTATFLARYTGVVAYETHHRDSAAIMRHLSRMPGLTGVDLRTARFERGALRGYYALGRPVPLYLSWGHYDIPAERRSARVSHIVTDDTAVAPPGFELAERFRRYLVWQAQGPRPALPIDPDDLYAAATDPVPPDYRPFGRKVEALRDQLHHAATRSAPQAAATPERP